jgi:hypothetical protein
VASQIAAAGLHPSVDLTLHYDRFYAARQQDTISTAELPITFQCLECKQTHAAPCGDATCGDQCEGRRPPSTATTVLQQDDRTFGSGETREGPTSAKAGLSDVSETAALLRDPEEFRLATLRRVLLYVTRDTETDYPTSRLSPIIN